MQSFKRSSIFYAVTSLMVLSVFGLEAKFNSVETINPENLLKAIKEQKIVSNKYGVASFYGKNDGFDGRQTASGQVFDAMNYTAAHRTLSFGTKVLVTNLNNGKKILVTINDRGPFHPNREIDLSYGAAKEIGIVSKGLAKVMISVLG